MENTLIAMSVILLGLYFTIIIAVALPIEASTTDNSCDSSLEDQHLPHDTDCSKYYRCVYGKKVPKECPEKMLFNPSIGNCDLYYNVDCPFDKTQEIQEDPNLDQALDSLTGRNFVKISTTSKDSTAESETSTMKFTYMPHDSDPQAYYKIENGERVLMYCQDGMVFWFELEICARSSNFT